MKIVGGYFELELTKGAEYHGSALRLNTGRNAFEYILRAKKYKKVYIPYYTCDVLLQPINRLGLAYKFYSINEAFEPVFSYDTINDNEAFLYTNYFGLKDKFVAALSKKCKNLIIDNSQSFFSKPIKCIDTFYSPRKYLGVPDGAYLYTETKLDMPLEKDISYKRFEHLLRRIDLGAENGYFYFKKSNKLLDNLPIKEMSTLTQRLLKNIDYKSIAENRKNNFLSLHAGLKKINILKLELYGHQVPMTYPFMSNNSELRLELIKNKIFVAQYWPNVTRWSSADSLEYKYAVNIVHLPISQMCAFADMKRIINLISKFDTSRG